MADAQVQSALNAAKARYADLAKQDISSALSHFRDIYPGTDFYIFNDGSRRQLVTLTGTLPVSYRGNTYNIPVCLYLMDTHPYYPPICYVRPTQDMVIKPSQHVDNSGKIYLPYLHEWRYPSSDLMGLLQIMAIVFSDQSPVFAKSSSSSSLSSVAGGGHTPYPTSGGYGMPTPSTGGYPQYPPSPAGGYTPPYPPTSTAAQNSNSPPYPAYSGYPTNPSYTPTRPLGASTIQPEHIRLSLVSAIEDKLRSKLRDTMGTSHAELQSIKKTREDLVAGEQKIKSMLSKLKQEQDDLDVALIAYRDYIEEVDRILAQASDAENFEIDESIDTTTPLFRQLLNSYVEDNALEDTIYYLGQALKLGRLDLESYMKHIRTLSRQQFMFRATMQRCRQVAGLDA